MAQQAVEPQSLFQNSDFARDGEGWWFGADAERTQVSYFAFERPEFKRAARLELAPKDGDQLWSAQWTQPFGAALRAGEPITLKFWARSPQSLKMVVNLEDSVKYQKFFTREIALTPDWKEYEMTGQSNANYGAGGAQLDVFVGGQIGQIEVANVRATKPRTVALFNGSTVAKAPDGGALVVAQSKLEPLGGDGFGRVTQVEVTGQPFSNALRLETIKRPPNEWDFQLGAWSAAPVAAGDAMLASFYARAVKGQAETGEAQMTLDFQTGAPNWEKSISQNVGLGAEWKRFDVPFVARHSLPTGGALTGFRLGFNPQIIELGGFSLTNYGANIKVSDLPRTSSRYAGDEPDAPWRAEANARIEKIRKGDLLLQVRNAKGEPLPGAKIELRQSRHAFPFGTTVAADLLVAQGADTDKYRELLKENYTRASIENHLKWPFFETWGREDALKSVSWLNQNGLEVTGHNLIWPGWSDLPADLPALKDDKAALQKRIDGHFAEILGATKGQITEWHVVNEPYSKHDLLDILGRDAMADWFKLAQKYDPKPTLFINDYPPLDGAALSNEHLNSYFRDIKRLQELGAPIEGIGFQCHFGSNPIPPQRVLSGLDRFAGFGLPISITEFDMDTQDEELQARFMRDFMTAAFSHPSVQSIMLWGFWEGKHWMPNAALYRQDWSIKPNGQMWLDLVKKAWWTNADGATGTNGQWQTRGFYGDYQATVTTADGAKQSFPISIAKGATAPVVLRLK